MKRYNTTYGLIITAASVSIFLFAAAGATLASGGGDRPSNVSNAASAAIAAAQTDRVTSIEQRGGTLEVKVKSDKSRRADQVVSSWYGRVVAREAAGQIASSGATVDSISELDESGAQLGGGPDAVTGISPVPPLPSRTCTRLASGIAAEASLEVLEAKQINILNGGCAFIVAPTGDNIAFIKDAGSHLYTLLGAMPDVASHPYLVQVVDTNDEPELVLGWIPGVGGIGEGVSWIKPGLQSSAMTLTND
jgi:hypothetical protein